ncbi:hypothetical protein [Nocardia brasiliensis]|uniref:hypothetical protein n=1 Tax=Nocardia brasiliensis TaxID=37326 RepID=UPI003D8E57AF
MSEHTDFVVLRPDGTAVYGSRDHGKGLPEAIRGHIPDLSTQGMGPVRAWFADNFGDPRLQPNLLADQVLGRLGYKHPSGWYGPVAVTMEEDGEGYVPPLAPEVREVVEDLSAGTDGPDIRTAAHSADILDAAILADHDSAWGADIDSGPTESAQTPLNGPGTGADL